MIHFLFKILPFSGDVLGIQILVLSDIKTFHILGLPLHLEAHLDAPTDR